MWHVLYRRMCFLMETYGCTSWSSYIVAMISGFILSSLPLVSQFYWIAPLLPSSTSPQSLFLPILFIAAKKIHLDLSHACTHTNTHRHDH